MPTDEVFKDPVTDRLMRVWADRTGQRHYLPESEGAGGSSSMTGPIDLGSAPPDTAARLRAPPPRPTRLAGRAGGPRRRRATTPWPTSCAPSPSGPRPGRRSARSARDDIEAYACFRVGYHRGLDALRRAGWRGSGFVRWAHLANRGFLRCVDGLRAAAAAIGETAEEERCALFLRQLDPSWPPARGSPVRGDR